MAEQCQWIGQRAQRYILELDILEQCNLTVESLRSNTVIVWYSSPRFKLLISTKRITFTCFCCFFATTKSSNATGRSQSKKMSLSYFLNHQLSCSLVKIISNQRCICYISFGPVRAQATSMPKLMQLFLSFIIE